MQVIQLGQARIEGTEGTPAQPWSGWGVVIDLSGDRSASQLERYRRCLQAAGVLPIIMAPEQGDLLPGGQTLLSETSGRRLLVAGGSEDLMRALSGWGHTVLGGLDTAAAGRVRDGDWLVVTPLMVVDSGGAIVCQALALRDVRPPWFEVERVADGIFAITEPGHQEWVRSFLVLGRGEAALIDTGMGIDDIRPVVDSLTDLPVRVILTHAHWDHIGGVHSFERVAIHPAEKPALAQGAPSGSERLAGLCDQLREKFFGRPWPPYFDPDQYQLPGYPGAVTIEEGDRIDLGGRILEVLHTPGHSQGSICLLDKANRQLFIGDTLYYGPLYCDNVAQYLETARRLAALADQVERVFPAHNEIILDGRPMSGQDLLNLRAAFEQLAQQQAENVALPIYDFPHGRFSVLAGFPY